MIFKRINLNIIFLAICICIIFTSCSSKNNVASNREVKLIDFKGIEKEFLDYMKKLNWPEGYSLPKKLDGETAERFQVGYGETRASMFWECAWQKEWLKFYRTDSKRANKALKELEKAKDMYYMSPQKCDDATRRYFKENLEKARLGDPSGFEENIRLNSPE